MDDDALLGGLNNLVNQADKPQKAAGKPAVQPQPVQQQAQQPVQDGTRQILDRLDGIKAAIDGLARPASSGPSPASTGQPSVVLAEKPAMEKPRPPAPKPAPVQVQRPEGVSSPSPSAGISPQPPRGYYYLVLVSAAMVLTAFALGMGYGAVVASGKYPFWSAPGLSGALADWIAAPAGILLLPVIAALLYLGGQDLQRDDRGKLAIGVFIFAGALALLALILPFL